MLAGSRLRPCTLGAVAFVVAALGSGASEAPGTPAEILEGIARDPGGRALQAVEVLVARLSAPDDPARVTTDANGRFAVPGIAPGLYRVTATKSGYDAASLRVNTLVRSTLDLILRPAGEPAPAGERPERIDWVLRLTSRDLLEDRKREVVREGEAGAGARASVAWRPEVSGAVEQWYWAGTPFGDGEFSDERGLVTSLELASPLTPRSRLRVRGSRFQEDTAVPGADDVSELVRHEILLDASVLATSRGNVDLRSYFDRSVRGLPFAADRDRSEGDEGAWGCEARFGTSLGRESAFEAALTYHEASVDLDGPLAAAAYGAPDEGLGSRALGASAGWSGSPGNRHTLRVGVRARGLDAEDESLHLTAGHDRGLREAAFGPSQWDVALSGEDEWRLGRLVALSYGVHYRRADIGDAVSVLVPKAGLRLSPAARTRLSSAVSVTAADEGWSSRTASEGSAPRVGYRLAAEQGVGARNVLSIAVERRPGGHGQTDLGPAELVLGTEAGRLYVADPAADSRWWGGAWTFRFQEGVAVLGVERGEVRGRVAPRLPGDLPVVALAPDRLVVGVAHVELRWQPSRTVLRLAHDAVRAAAGGDTLLRDYGRVSFFLDQELPFLKVRDTRWRFLLAFEETLEGETSRGGGVAADIRAAAVAGHRISGGVAVSF